MWYLLREIFDLAIESLSKVRRLKKQRVIAEKKAFKWEVNIKMRNSYKRYFMYLEIKYPLLKMGISKKP